MIAKHRTTLDVEQDLGHQKLEWRIEHGLWVVILLVLGAALAGLLGPGPMSWATVQNADRSLQVEYTRIAHIEAPSVLRVFVAEQAVHGDQIKLLVNRQFIRNVHISRIDPDPESVVAGRDFFTYVFAAHDPSEPTMVQIHHEPNEMGPLELAVRLDDGPSAQLKVFVLP